MADLSATFIFLFFVSAFLLYFVPMLIARSRKVVKLGRIVIMNLFLGWTGLGWIGAMIWACTADTEFDLRLRAFQQAQMDAAQPDRDLEPSGALRFGRSVGSVLRRDDEKPLSISPSNETR